MKIQSNYLLRVLKKDYNPFTANNIIIHNDRIEFKKRNSHLISMDSQQLEFDRISGIDINKHLIGATIIVKSVGSKPIVVEGLTKTNAEKIRQIWIDHRNTIGKNDKRNIDEDPDSKLSKLERLSQLKRDGALTTGEFQQLKNELLK